MLFRRTGLVLVLVLVSWPGALGDLVGDDTARRGGACALEFAAAAADMVSTAGPAPEEEEAGAGKKEGMGNTVDDGDSDGEVAGLVDA